MPKSELVWTVIYLYIYTHCQNDLAFYQKWDTFVFRFRRCFVFGRSNFERLLYCTLNRTNLQHLEGRFGQKIVPAIIRSPSLLDSLFPTPECIDEHQVIGPGLSGKLAPLPICQFLATQRNDERIFEAE